MNLNLIGTNALVCGGSKGIGHASAVELARLGSNITLVSRSVENLSEALSTLPKVHGQQHHDFLSVDFSNIDDVQKKIKSLVLVKPIHILINNTGGPPAGSILNAEQSEFFNAFSNHLIVNQIITGLLVPGMKKHQYGRIINIISTSVKIPLKGLGVSNTVRAAVASWAKSLSYELAPFGITINNILPGATDTERLKDIINTKVSKTAKSKDEVTLEMQNEIPMGRFGLPSEIGAVVAFLASPAASYITGINLPVDGGRTGAL